ncbi:MAG TPA: nitrous oxide reductase family maturation protein NosD [Gemmatimonadales bacterium]
MIAALVVALAGPIVVQPAGPVRTLTAALALARPGDRIVVRPGSYREPAIVVTVPVEIIGEGGPVFEGGAHPTLVVRADGVTVRGLDFAHVTPNPVEDRAAILLDGVRGCRIESNRIRDAFFGIYAVQSADCRITGNRLTGSGTGTSSSGNGIHLWRSRGMVVEDNVVTGHRDGIYFEFVAAAEVHGNTIEGNQRYGLHFMRSDSCTYERNTFARNGAGVAVMYSRAVRMIGNRFERNWGGSAYGLLLKEISDGEVRGNRFVANTVGLYLEDSNRNLVTGNRFSANGWAVKVMANATDNRFAGNVFEGNSFDVATNSRSTASVFEGNWWDHYRGYDLDRDGYGDVPHRPVRLFSLVVEQHEPSLILLRSAFVDLLDGAERLMPVLTPEALVDRRPLMARPK